MNSHNHLEILTTKDSSRWQEILDKIGIYDCYHLPSYHRVAELHGEGEAVLLAFENSDCAIAFPMLIRNIELPGIVSASDGVKDVSSVYGYPGPVASSTPISPETAQQFYQAMQDYFEHNSIVCAFSRLNPIIQNPHIMEGYGETLEMGSTFSIDLTIPPEAQYRQYRQTHRKQVRRLREKGFTSSLSDMKYLNDFLRIYRETMDRNEADEYYYFNAAYFENLMEKMPGVAQLFLCWHGGEPVSAMIAFACKGIVQGHLGGTLSQYMAGAPMKMVYDAVRLWGNEIGAHTFHFGGGKGGQKDSLYAYKQGFTEREHTFRVWRHTVDQNLCQDLYSQLCQTTGITPENEYFPSYRNPAFK